MIVCGDGQKVFLLRTRDSGDYHLSNRQVIVEQVHQIGAIRENTLILTEGSAEEIIPLTFSRG